MTDIYLNAGSNRMFSNSVFDIDGKFRKKRISKKEKSIFIVFLIPLAVKLSELTTFQVKMNFRVLHYQNLKLSDLTFYYL
jgi:hypothetical protein